MTRPRTITAAIALFALVPSQASGQAPPEPAPLSATLGGNTKADYEEGRRLLARGDFAGALARFERAYASVPDARLAANIALCEKALGHCPRSTALFEGALASGAALFTASQQNEIRRAIAACAPRIARVRVLGAPAGVRVTVDGAPAEPLSNGGELVLAPGGHRLRFSADGYRDAEAALELAAGDHRDVPVTLAPVVHAGTLSIKADDAATIEIDGKPVGHGAWEGRLTPGAHDVQISAPGKESRRVSVAVVEDERRTLDVTLAPSSGTPVWLWAVGGTIVVTTVITAVVAVLRPAGTPAPEPSLPATASPLRVGH